MIRFFRRLTALTAALLAVAQGSADAGTEGPSAGTHLFRAGLRNETVVFFPSAEIDSPEDASAYLRWAAESHPGRLRAVWDVDGDIPLVWAQKYDAGFLLREGDDAVDSTGRIAFVVDQPPKDGGRSFTLRLAEPIERGKASPEICFTNAWILSRRTLFNRWRRDLAAGRASAVRSDLRQLQESGRYKAPGGAEWEDAVEKFLADTPELWLPVHFENRADHRVLVACEGSTKSLAPGESWDATVRTFPADGSVHWTAWDDIGLCDKDYKTPGEGNVDWNPLARTPAPVILKGDYGVQHPAPKILLGDFIPAALRGRLDAVRLRVVYGDGSQTGLPIHAMPDGTPYAEIDPHRPVETLELKAAGYQSRPVNFKGAKELPFLCRGGKWPVEKKWPSEFVLRRPPWPGHLVVRNASGHEAKIRSDHLPLKDRIVSSKGQEAEQSIPISLDAPELENVDEYTFDLRAKTAGTFDVTLLETNLVARRGGQDLMVEIPAPPRGEEPHAAPPSETPLASQPASSPPATKPEPRNPETETVVAIVQPSTPPVQKPETPESGKPPRSKTPPTQTTSGGTFVASAHPFPAKANLDQAKGDLVALLKKADINGQYSEEEKKSAADALLAVQNFWKSGSKETPWIKTFRSIVAHFATCRNGCPDCQSLRKETLGKGSNPKTEAFTALGGWVAEKQRKFRAQHSPKVDWRSLPYSVRNWSDRLKELLEEPSPENLQWGWDLLSGNENAGKIFRDLYIHVETCSGATCEVCKPYRYILRKPTFEERRDLLFKELLRNGQMYDYQKYRARPPSEEQIKKFLELVKQWKETK